MNAGTASFEEKKKRQTVKMKKLVRSVIPWRLRGGLANMVAIMTPITIRTNNLDTKSSGVRLMILKFRFMRIQVSEKKELENLGPRFWCVVEFGTTSGVK